MLKRLCWGSVYFALAVAISVTITNVLWIQTNNDVAPVISETHTAGNQPYVLQSLPLPNVVEIMNRAPEGRWTKLDRPDEEHIPAGTGVILHYFQLGGGKLTVLTNGDPQHVEFFPGQKCSYNHQLGWLESGVPDIFSLLKVGAFENRTYAFSSWNGRAYVRSYPTLSLSQGQVIRVLGFCGIKVIIFRNLNPANWKTWETMLEN